VNACRRLTVIAAVARSPAATFRPISAVRGAGGPIALDWSQALASWAQARFASGGAPLLEDAMPEFERTVIREALRATHGGRQEAAKLLGWAAIR